MRLGVYVIIDENGEVIEENKLIIEDGATTTICKERGYEFGWNAHYI